ncbi:MAG TPA: HAD family phosphatase [Candidatus Methanoperedens sp.]
MKAIIFDMDGVLVDSMPYHAEAWKQAFAFAGISIHGEDIYELEGSNHRQIIDILYRRFGRIPTEKDIQELTRRKRDIYNQIERALPFEGMTELLASLKSRYKLAVVSGSDRKTVHGIINTFFPGTFDVIIDGEDTDKSKPSPLPYLKAIEKLGIPKEHCLVIENAPLGIRAAKNAGLRCIAIPTYLDREQLKEADVIIDSHRELGKYLI